MKSSIGSVIAGTALALVVTGYLSPDAALAQSSAGGGTIQGTVKDATGGVIPGASVIIRQLETGLVTNTVANNEGFFSTPPLNIGKYKIRVESPGMKAWESDRSQASIGEGVLFRLTRPPAATKAGAPTADVSRSIIATTIGFSVLSM